MGRHKERRPFVDDKLKPPKSLSARQSEIFEYIVTSVDDYHFSPVDQPLLCQYVGAAALAEEAQGHLDENGAVSLDGLKVSPWVQVLEKASRSCVALSARLRICPQSRYDRLVAGANSRQTSKRVLWADEHDPDDPDNLLARPNRPLPSPKTLAYFRLSPADAKRARAQWEGRDEEDDELLA